MRSGHLVLLILVGALDSSEIHALAATAAVRGLQPFPIAARYTFGDLLGESSSSHIEDAVDGLRLAAGARAETVAIVQAVRDEHPAAATVILLCTARSAVRRVSARRSATLLPTFRRCDGTPDPSCGA